MLNSFQRWAKKYAEARDCIIEPRGNWVVVYAKSSNDDGAECMSWAGVMAYCDAAQS